MKVIAMIVFAGVIMYLIWLLYKFVTTAADVQIEKDKYIYIHTALQNGWVYNQHTMQWENRYEPMRFNTDAMIEFVQENYIIKKPRN